MLTQKDNAYFKRLLNQQGPSGRDSSHACVHFPALHYKKGGGEFELIQGFSPAVPLSALVSLPGYFPQCWVFGSAVKRTSVSSVNAPPTLFCLSKLLERAR